MYIKMKPNSLIMLMILLFLIGNTSFSYGHRMSIREIETGLIQVYYADGTFPAFGEVILYSEGYVELHRGSLSEMGTFQMPPEIEAYWVVVNDGMGHQARWRVGDDTSSNANDLRGIILIGLVFIYVAFFFHIRTKKKLKSS